MATIYNQISSNKQKTFLVMFLFVVLVSFVGFLFGQISGYGNSFVVFALIFSFISSFSSYYFSDSLALAISGAQKITKGENPYLVKTVENLCLGAGMRVPQIYLIDDTAINAFATGRDPKHAAIVFTKGAVKRLENEELEGVAAHELSHIKNFDTRLMVVVAILVGSLTLLSDYLMRSFLFRGRRSSDDKGANTIIMLVGFVLILMSPLIATLIQLAISRNREYLADASSALLTRYPKGLAGALQKIAQDKEPLEVANKATAHLYISNPLKNHKDSVSWFAGLFNTHPPVEERIKRLMEM